jgi:hypothetical protein
LKVVFDCVLSQKWGHSTLLKGGLCENASALLDRFDPKGCPRGGAQKGEMDFMREDTLRACTTFCV